MILRAKCRPCRGSVSGSGAARNGGAPEPASGSAGPGRCLSRAHRPGAFLRPPLPPRSRPGPAMRPLLILLILLLPLGRAAAPGPANSTEAPRAATGNGTRPSPETRRPPGPGLLAGPGLPVLRRAVYVLSALSALAALYFVLRAFRLKKPQKKYGLLSSHDENIELGSLDSDEDTVFETRNLRR
ncbi:protein FAM174C isoform X2 [Pipra filicauda]|uniref:Protein FAM174C isoform X1 n=2 Tax=Pipridae TaxID=114313 RepID=A0A6J2G959_9PASS|nr:protein FAM174C isoform X1 [Pipra filicauda]XP_027571630.2 protein FAM174C isoform X2 [Pipra filicauda]